LSKYSRVRFFETQALSSRQVATLAMETTQLVLSQFKDIITYELRIE